MDEEGGSVARIAGNDAFGVTDVGNMSDIGAVSSTHLDVYKRQGDSVSCGEVSEAVDYVGKEDPVHDGQYSNSWYSYAWMTARKLGAELHDTSQGGIALLDGTGWFGAPAYYGVESCYDRLEYNPDLGEVKKWDFSRYTPQVVVVAIGQHDNHPVDYMAADPEGSAAEHWRKRYREFIEILMKHYPCLLYTSFYQHEQYCTYQPEGRTRVGDGGCVTSYHFRMYDLTETVL